MIHDPLRPILVEDLRPTFLDLRERFIVGDALELVAALGPDALHCVEKAVGVVVMLSVVLELHAQTAARHWMIGIARYLYQLAIFNVVQERAGIWAILRASASHDTGFANVR